MLINNNVWLIKMEGFLKKLTKTHSDLIKLEGWHSPKKLCYMKMSFFEKFYERFLKVAMLIPTYLIIGYCYFFYVYVWHIIFYFI